MEIPVVSFGIGGIGEYLQHDVNGWLVAEASPQVTTLNSSIKLAFMHIATIHIYVCSGTSDLASYAPTAYCAIIEEHCSCALSRCVVSVQLCRSGAILHNTAQTLVLLKWLATGY
jgi:hypothetical protein